MLNFTIPDDYKSLMSLKETEIAIKKVKDYFERQLAEELNLTRVSAPIFVRTDSGLNDNLNGHERPVSFDIATGEELEIVHSLAKWKRMALKTYGFKTHEGLYTDMNAIRRDEELDNIHSIFVDQWDWERIIEKNERTEETLKNTVNSIYKVLKSTEDFISSEYPFVDKILPESIAFVSAQELEDRYPTLSPKEREYEICKEKKAVFLMQIGETLRSGNKHDGRAPDYDDWTLNGDILVYYPVLDIALELSSMGIRVDEDAMRRQLRLSHCEGRAVLPFHKELLAGNFPYTIGGGIGQSRMCLFFLKKAHIGEVQASFWTENDHDFCEKKGINLL